jgi:SAM-dependent methyltransferase
MQNSSFRDPDGFVFRKNGILYRQLNHCFENSYEKLMRSGLFQFLTTQNMLINHHEADLTLAYDGTTAYKILQPSPIPYISYPYEWCFDQYKNAALLTLDLQLAALKHDMILKDATAYNVQFVGAAPIFIDTSSFDVYQEGQAWDAYGQFCRHFLAPLILMAAVDASLSKLMQIHVDGIPLNLAVSILKGRKRFNLAALIHLYMHAKQQTRAGTTEKKVKRIRIPKNYLVAIANNLRSFIAGLKLPREYSPWGDYYEKMHNYSVESFLSKTDIVREFLARSEAKKICDLGANNGRFSTIAADIKDSYVVSCDMDSNAINSYYQEIAHSQIQNVLPLMLDLTNPSPAIGWASEERMSFTQRADFDCVMVLALCHHLALSNNLPFDNIAAYFSGLCRHFIIEFVPKTDSQIQKMLLNRKDIFGHYHQENFESAFERYFDRVDKKQVAKSNRVIYWYALKKGLMKNEDNML